MGNKHGLGSGYVPHLPLVIVQDHKHADRLPDHVHFHDLALPSIRKLHQVALLRKLGVQVGIGICLILQAAHQTSADAADLLGIQGKILFLRHFDGDRDKIRQPGVTAQRAPAGAHAADDPGLVPDTHLTELDPHVEDRRQVLHQVAEIHSSVRSEEKQELTVIERILRPDDLHVQLPLIHLSPADHQGILFPVLVVPDLLFILRGRPADDLFSLGVFFRRVVRVVPEDHCPVFISFCRFRDDVVSPPEDKISRIKGIDLSDLAEPDSDYCRHSKISFLLLRPALPDLLQEHFQRKLPADVRFQTVFRPFQLVEDAARAAQRDLSRGP